MQELILGVNTTEACIPAKPSQATPVAPWSGSRLPSAVDDGNLSYLCWYYY